MPQTIHDFELATSALPTAEFLMWDAENNYTRRISKANMMGGTITGGGSLSTNGYTGILPASGTLAMQSVAQTWTAMQTFGAGISLGNEAMQTYRRAQSWTPVVTSSGSAPTITAGIMSGRYWRFDELVFYRIAYNPMTVTVAGTGDLRISLPLVVSGANYFYVGFGSYSNVNVPGTPYSTAFSPTLGTSYGTILFANDNAVRTALQVSDLKTGDGIFVNGFYETA